MSMTVAIVLFSGGLFLCMMSSVVLSERLEPAPRVGLTVEVGAPTLGWTGSIVRGLLLLAVALPYGVLSSLRRNTVRSLRVPQGARRWIERHAEARESEEEATELDPLTFTDGL
jgi:hypothetical protein